MTVMKLRVTCFLVTVAEMKCAVLQNALNGAQAAGQTPRGAARAASLKPRGVLRVTPSKQSFGTRRL